MLTSHQHYTSIFRAEFLLPKNTNPIFNHTKGAKNTFLQKGSHKMLVKLTLGKNKRRSDLLWGRSRIIFTSWMCHRPQIKCLKPRFYFSASSLRKQRKKEKISQRVKYGIWFHTFAANNYQWFNAALNLFITCM